MIWTWTQVLADSQQFHVRDAEIFHGSDDFCFSFAEADHQGGFGMDFMAGFTGDRGERFDRSQDGKRFFVIRARVADVFLKTFYRFNIMGDDVGRRGDDFFQRFFVAVQIRNQNFNPYPGNVIL